MVLDKVTLLVNQLRIRVPDLESTYFMDCALFLQEAFGKSTEGTHSAFLSLKLSGELVQESLNLIGHDEAGDLFLGGKAYFEDGAWFV